MANNVYTHINLTMNDAATKKWNELIERFEQKEGELSIWYLMMDEWKQGAGDLVGAKWAYADDYDEDSMQVVSAWGPVTPFCEWLADELGQVDPDVRVEVRYEDEMPNFIGVAVFGSAGLIYEESIDWDEVQEYLISEYPELRDPKNWDEEENEYTDEGQELLWDVQWECYYNWQDKCLEEF